MDDLEKKIIWLAGLTDGEGTITVFTHQDNSQKWKCRRYTAIFCIVNTDPNIINEVSKILNELGVKSYLFVRKRKSENHSTALQLNTRKMSDVKILLLRLLPYLIGKKAQAELVLRFIDSRFAQREIKKNRYTHGEKEICALLYTLNKRGRYKSSETIRQTPKGDDIVRTEAKVSELQSLN